MACGTLERNFNPTLGFQYLQLPNSTANKVRSILAPFKLSINQISRLWDCFSDEMVRGLQKSPSVPACVQMENTYVTDIPNGMEKGEYLAIDLGGTNFRVIYCVFDGGKITNVNLEHIEVPEALRSSHSEKLFDFLAESILNFAMSQNLNNRRILLGLTFSFPVQQHGVNKAILLSWAMSFTCPNAVGKDVVQLLRDALDRKGNTNIDVAGIINDSTGTLIYGAFLRSNCTVGTILGSGTNACYIEKIANVERWEGSNAGIREALINTEWGQLGDNGCLDFISTDVDNEIDKDSSHPGKFMLERYIGGNFIGDIVRRIMLKMTSEGCLFAGTFHPKLKEMGSIPASFVSEVEKDNIEGSMERTRLLTSRFYEECNDEDISIVKEICYVVSERVALLFSSVLSCLLFRMERNDISIAVDGSLYEHHPRMHTMIGSFVKSMLPQLKFELFLAKDGSGKGGALIAAVIDRKRKLDTA